MLVLTFRVAEAPFAVAVGRVVEVVPRVPLRALPHAPHFLAGLLHFRGLAVPVVDLAALLGQDRCAERLNTRIILVNTATGGPKSPARLVGLIAERVDDVRSVDESHASMPSARFDAAPYLGAVHQVDGVLVQLIEPERVLPETGSVAATLADPAEAS